MDERKTFSQLLDYRCKLENQKISMFSQDRPAFNQLLTFLCTAEENLHWTIKDDYIELMQDFLSAKIDSENFSIIFMNLFESVNKKLNKLLTEYQKNNFRCFRFANFNRFSH